MNTWADVCGYREFFGGDILLDALKNNSVTLRSELWTWLAEKLPLSMNLIINIIEKIFKFLNLIFNFHSPF